MHHSNQPLDLTLSYAARGWPVFPVRAKEEYDDITGEVYAPKTPYTSNGLRGASTNTRIINEWWKRYPDAMVGVPTGDKIGAFVVDLDIKPGVGDGHEWLADMEAEHGPLPLTARAKTMGGGTHIFFRHVDGVRNRGRLGVCVDIRGQGGYIVAPGSQATDGRSYEWLNDAPIADAPDWLLALLLPPPVTNARHDYAYSRGDNEPYVERAVELELSRLSSTGRGNRGYQLNASAFSLGQLVGAGALSRREAEAGLYDAAAACGVLAKDGERQVLAAIKRGLDSGERQPRAIPERQANNDNTRLVDISRMIANGLAKARDAAVSAEKDVHSKHTLDDAPDVQDSDPPQEPPTAAPDGIFITPYTFKDPATLARREFAYGSHYIRKYVSVTVSPGGLGKTSNSIVEALSMTSGRALTGTKPPKRMKVWLFNAEDPRDEMERRIQAACLHYKLSPDDINGWLFLDTGREQELVVAVDDRKAGVRYQVPIIESVIANLKANEIDVMIVDPFVSTHGVNENDNGAIDKVAKLWAHIADETNTAVDVVHHLRKVADREATVEDARGAVALIGAARSVRVLNRMSEEQANLANVPKDERFSYFNIHQGKANLTKMSASMDWRKLESVPLGNGRGLTKPQDHAGVVTEWRWPGSEEIKDGLTDEQMANIKSTLAGGAYKSAPQGRPWAGEAIAYVLGVDIDDKAEKKRVGGILKALLAEGVLATVEERDPMSRQVASFVRAA
jgi:hypothetical protein